jgi:hypothetical protein
VNTAHLLFLFLVDGNTTQIDKFIDLLFPLVSGLCLNIYFGLRRLREVNKLYES